MTDNYQVDMGWVNDQLISAGYSHDHGANRQFVATSVRLLVQELNKMNHDRATKIAIIDLFGRLANGQVIAPSNVQGTKAWRDFDLSSAKVGDSVRVRDDAYDGEAGQKHNGMVGILAAARSGEAVVQYANSTDTSGQRHAPDKLQRLVEE